MENLVDLTAKSKRQRHYETIFIIAPNVSESKAKELIEKNAKVLGDTKATVLRQDDWGKKRMAYPMKKHAMGQYVYFRYIGTQEGVQALERSLKLDANILKYLSVRLSDPLSQAQIADLVERAPKEQSSCPNARGDEEDFALEASYN